MKRFPEVNPRDAKWGFLTKTSEIFQKGKDSKQKVFSRGLGELRGWERTVRTPSEYSVIARPSAQFA